MDGKKKAVTVWVVLQMLFFVVVLPFLPLLIARQWDWWEAWVYAAVSVLGFIASRLLAAKRNPDLIAERARFNRQEDIQPWDRKMVPLIMLAGILILGTAGLDQMLGWSPAFPPWVKLAALVVLIGGYGLSSAALVVNRFFSGNVRLQNERGHVVVSAGPYRWMRHPGYAGGLLANLVTPLLLDSWWTFLPVLLALALTVYRTAKEDRFLQENLAGYPAYAGKTRFRLLPGIW